MIGGAVLLLVRQSAARPAPEGRVRRADRLRGMDPVDSGGGDPSPRGTRQAFETDVVLVRRGHRLRAAHPAR